MIKGNRGHQGDIRIYNIDGIEAAAQADFKQQDTRCKAPENFQRRQSTELKIAQCFTLSRHINCRKRIADHCIGLGNSVNADAFVVA